MRIIWTILLAATCMAARSEVHYFEGSSATVPAGEIRAVEVRASCSRLRVGSSKVSGWTITWPGVELRLELSKFDMVDGINNASVTLTCGNETRPIGSGMNIEGGFNTIAVEWDADGNATVLAGERGLAGIIKGAPLPRPRGNVSVGGINGSSPDIADLIIESDDNSFERLKTSHSAAELESATKWVLLDGEYDTRKSHAGGSYVLAQIGNDLVYMGGAKTNSGHWHCGMLKGRLVPTGFVGYYKLEWIDATGRSLTGMNYVEADEDAGTLKMVFPELNATMRFARRISNDAPTEKR